MFRNLILLIVIGIVIWLVKRMIKSKQQGSQTNQNPENVAIKNIVQCHMCKVFIPEDKSIKHDKLSFCSQRHLEEWKENH